MLYQLNRQSPVDVSSVLEEGRPWFGLETFGYLASDFVRPAGRPPTHSGLMTKTKLARLITAGYGQHHFYLYKPWLRVTRRTSSPCSTTGHLPFPEWQRLLHFRSVAERRVLILLRWLGALDARDQFPCWPWEHDHPLCGLPGMAAPRQPGLLEIARLADIDHGTFVGTSIPYVATIDIMATWACPRVGFSLVAYDCKPKTLLLKAPPGSRLRERMELHRRYCVEGQIERRQTHAELLPKDLVANLDALSPLHKPTVFSRLARSDVFSRVVDACERSAYDMPAFAVVEEASVRGGFDQQEAKEALRAALWTQTLDHDLSKPLELWNPLVRGGRRLRQELLLAWGPGSHVP